MNQAPHPEIPATNGYSRLVSRSHSVLSEKPVFSKSILSSPPAVSPDPVYISSSAASQWVSAELDDDDLSVSEAALSLLNSFLDQLLFSFLSTARSTRLPQLRQAIPDVLKPRLGKEAMASADEELREYLGDGDDEELSDVYDGQEPATGFDLDLAWKLARLRCMVYTRLGDLEEEDALEIIEREQLDKDGAQQRGFPGSSNSITPAGAIFLTSIVEYLGEQALYHAGIFAQTRATNVHPQVHESSADTAGFPPRSPRNAIEEIDVRRLGSEGPLARIWRNWRRPVRSPQESFSQSVPPSDDGNLSPPSGSPRQLAASTVGIVPLPTIAQTIHSDDPAQIPLPLSENDVNEIEIPGLAREIDDGGIAGSEETLVAQKAKRSSSMTFLPHNVEQASTQPSTPTSIYIPSNVPPRNPLRPVTHRQRSRSLPIPPTSPLTAMQEEHEKDGESILPTESDKLSPEEGSSKAIENDMPVEDAVARGERPSKKHGLVIGAIPEQADTQELQSTVVDDHLEPRGAEPATTSRETVADKMLHRPAAEDQVSPSALTEASIHDATDFSSMHLPQRRDTFMAEPAGTPDAESDPEDLALSSADDEPQPTKPRLKHDSVPPIRMGTSSYTYSTQPGDNYIPKPVLSDVPSAMPRRQIIYTDSKANQGIAAPSIRPDPRFSAEDRYYTAQSSPNPMAQIDTPAATERGSTSQSTLTRNTAAELSQHSSDSTSGSIPLGYQRDDQGRPQPSTADEDDVQPTAIASSPRAVNGTWHSPTTSTGAANGVRPGTAGSQKSSAKRPLKLHLSENSKEAPTKMSFESDARKKSLELLIQGDETLHYTLTPTSARAPDFPELIRQMMAEDASDYGDNVASSDPQPTQHDTQKSAGSIRSFNGLRAHPPTEEFAPQTSTAASFPATIPPRAASSRPGTSSSKKRHGEPRDAKVEPSTSRDLADYLRSTGPESDQQLPRPVISRPTTSTSPPPPPLSPRQAALYPENFEQTRTATKASGQLPLRSPDTPVGGGRTVTAATSKPSGAPRFVPRDAQVSNSATTSALADFIREGPPRAAGDHRIPRTVAPFRTTRDSDDLNGLASTDKDQPGRSSAASTQNSSTVSQSVQSSTSSHTALLERSKKTKPGPSANSTRTGTSTASSRSQPSAKDAVPKRKQRRVRDPYAVEDSDDDLVEVATLKPKRDEESLIDFLRNTAPQPSMTAQLVVSASSSAAPKKTLQKKNSSSAIRDRIRNTTIPGVNRKNSVMVAELPAYSRGSAARAESPHLSQSGSKLDSYKPTQPTHAAHVDRVRSARINGPVSRSAEHLPNGEQSRGVNATKDENGFMAFFSRKKSIRK